MWYFKEEKGWKQQNAALDPDLEIRGAPGHPDPYIRGGGGWGRSSRPLDILFGRQFGLKIRRGKGGGVGGDGWIRQ